VDFGGFTPRATDPTTPRQTMELEDVSVVRESGVFVAP
jgi:hypothetical protein